MHAAWCPAGGMALPDQELRDHSASLPPLGPRGAPAPQELDGGRGSASLPSFPASASYLRPLSAPHLPYTPQQDQQHPQQQQLGQAHAPGAYIDSQGYPVLLPPGGGSGRSPHHRAASAPYQRQQHAAAGYDWQPLQPTPEGAGAAGGVRTIYPQGVDPGSQLAAQYMREAAAHQAQDDGRGAAFSAAAAPAPAFAPPPAALPPRARPLFVAPQMQADAEPPAILTAGLSELHARTQQQQQHRGLSPPPGAIMEADALRVRLSCSIWLVACIQQLISCSVLQCKVAPQL